MTLGSPRPARFRGAAYFMGWVVFAWLAGPWVLAGLFAYWDWAWELLR